MTLLTTSPLIFLVAYLAAVATALCIVVAYLLAKRALLTRLENHHPEEWNRLGRPQFFLLTPPSTEAEVLSLSKRLREPLEPLVEDESLPPFSRMPKPVLPRQGRLLRWLLSNSTSVGDSETDGLIRRTRRLLVLSGLAIALLVAGTLAYVVLAWRFA